MSGFRLEAAGHTDIGLKRKQNEDALLMQQWIASEQQRFSCSLTTDVDAAPVVFLAADGIGGEDAGNVASRIAVETFRTALPNTPEAIVETATSARDAMREFAKINGRGERMGTTVAGLCVAESGLLAFSAGDCFVGRLSGRYCQPIVGSYEFLSNTSEVHQFIGAAANDSPMVAVQPLGQVVGRFVLLTDGVSRYVAPDLFDELVGMDNHPSSAVERVANAVMNAGAGDNFTIICVDVIPISDSKPHPGGD